MPTEVVAVKHNPVVSSDVLTKVLQWKMSGASQENAIKRLRLQLIPGYAGTPWSEGAYVYIYKLLIIMDHSADHGELYTEMLQSILAQFEYKYQILLWESRGFPFRTYIYVPETHPSQARNIMRGRILHNIEGNVNNHTIVISK